MSGRPAALAVDGGDLPLGGGLLSLVRPALEALATGGALSVTSSAPQLGEELAAWCKLEKHGYAGARALGEDRFVHTLVKSDFGAPAGEREDTLPPELSPDGSLSTASLLARLPMPERASVDTGFAPRGARVEPGGPPYPFRWLERSHLAPPEIGELYDQAVASRWSPRTDIEWKRIRPLPPALERALGQLMTFLAENELSALYVPARFLPQIHPAFVEVSMFLATQLEDEARHIDVFLKRARAGGGHVEVSSAMTSWSLFSLLEVQDLTESAFLLSVLGEGTFLDLLRYIEEHAPDEPTADIMRRARKDESRHVHFGMAHVRHALANDPSAFGRLIEAVRRRAARLPAHGSVPAPIQDALVVLAAGGTDPRAIRRGHQAYRELLEVMHHGRLKRLEKAGFTAEQAQLLSELHTPNFM